LHAGQVARVQPCDAQSRPALRRRLHAARRGEQPGVPGCVEVPGRQEQHLAARRPHLLDGRWQGAAARRMGPVLRQDQLRPANSYVTSGPNVASVTAQFPADNIDPGPRAGRLPTNPMLVNGPTVNYALLNTLYPAGQLQRNTGDVYFDTPDRVQPHTQQFSAGYQRQLGAQLSASADYVHTNASDQWLLENLNPGLRVNTTASGAIIRVDPNYVTNVWQRQNIGSYEYDALNVVLEKRDSHNWSGRASYTLAYSRGNFGGAETATNNYQLLNDPNLALGQGPTDFDRRHNLVLSGRLAEVPRTKGMTLSGTLRILSGLPFTLIDSNIDADRNGIL